MTSFSQSQCLNPDCLKQNPDGTKFCQKCGSKLLLREHYRAIKLIGEGGFGRTFLAIDEDKPSKPYCVIKQFLPQAQGTNTVQKASELFEQEAVRLDDLGRKHDQIPELFAYFTQDNRQYLVQEYIEGQNLTQELAEIGAFNESKIRSLLVDLLEVLQFVHQNQVIHRDIKPENIIRRQSDGKLVLVDFGAAKYATRTALGVTGTVIGSAEYVAPEQSRGKAIFASDLYSLGVTCINLLTSVSPFDLYDISENDWVWRQYLVNNSVSDELGQILDKLIEVGTKKRYQSAAEVLQAIESKPVTPTVISAVPKTSSSTRSPAPPPPVQSQYRQQKIYQQKALATFDFDVVTVTVNRQKSGLFGLGSKVTLTTNRRRSQAQYFTSDLGNGVFLDMVYIPGGTFIMGSPPGEEDSSDWECPQHQVTVQPFFMGKFQVTQAQWRVIASLPKIDIDLELDPSRFKGDSLPVECVSWYEAVEFCKRLSKATERDYRLPSEAEWEYACRAGTSTPFYFGETITGELANYNASDTYANEPQGEYRKQTTPVGQFPPNGFGLYDMHGNVWEWCADTWHDNYQGAPTDGSAWTGGENDDRSPLRGGSWLFSPQDCRSAFRLDVNGRDFRNRISGFRVVCGSGRTQ